METGEKFNEKYYLELFKKYDVDQSGEIEKEEMYDFIKPLLISKDEIADNEEESDDDD